MKLQTCLLGVVLSTSGLALAGPTGSCRSSDPHPTDLTTLSAESSLSNRSLSEFSRASKSKMVIPKIVYDSFVSAVRRRVLQQPSGSSSSSGPILTQAVPIEPEQIRAYHCSDIPRAFALRYDAKFGQPKLCIGHYQMRLGRVVTLDFDCWNGTPSSVSGGNWVHVDVE
ncbi:MAG TPA: hypothetical protein VE954_36785 [Oligoflexus sp.]|uniref:hypothetical protein n=1 Tax=Oligoflexus sp. TaxID=1971216 RepID=UPI002D2DDE99|nr:hypothetical protein [Oligoflexus sp.]HYX38694.1 hypothetical protein [Oligoflexus sp.]